MNNYNDETNSTPWDAPLEKKNTELFISPFYQDWTIILALATVVYSSWNSASSYGKLSDFASDDWVAIVVDIFFVVCVQGLFFGVIPAVLRRRWSKKSSENIYDQPALKSQWFWSLMIAAAVLTSLFTIMTSSSDSRSAASGEQCEQRGADELCLEVTDLGEGKVSLVSTWNYAESQIIDGQFVRTIRYGAVIDCNLRSGYVNKFETLDSSGARVNISQMNRQQMIDGIEKEQLSQIPDSPCDPD